MGNSISLYMYKWNVRFISLYNENDTKEKIIPIIENIRVKPESSVDRYPNLIQKYVLRPVFRKLKVYFSIQNDKYCAIWFMDEIKINNVFTRVFGKHADTPTDIIVNIDNTGRKYELALFRQGLKEPISISESAYQVIVFKNKFEDYRSENYNQPRGAWIW